jgi:capsular polysaccharide biosynthesis protein
MEFRDFIGLYIREKKLVSVIVMAAVAIAFFSYRLQTQWYEGETLLSVTRTATEISPDYRYDHFYRLQADERFADTLVRYLESEAGVRAVASEATLTSAGEQLFTSVGVKPVRLSSQLIRVTYAVRSLPEGDRVSEALRITADRYADDLNAQADERAWFTVIAAEPVVEDGRFGALFALVCGLGAGVFIAFWSVLFLSYWRRDESLKRS